jgi:SNF2 family DNA or RNA helicase
LEIFLRLRQICAHSALCSDNALIKAAISNYALASDELVVDDDLSAPEKFTPQHARQIFSLLQDAGDDICVVCGCDFDDSAASDDEERQEAGLERNVALLTKCSHLLCGRCFRGLKDQQQQQAATIQCPLCMQTLQGYADVLQVKPWPASVASSAVGKSKKSKAVSGNENGTSTSNVAADDDATMFTTAVAATDATKSQMQNKQQSLAEAAALLHNSMFPARSLERSEMSAKFKALINDLNTHFNPADSSPTKSVVFSQWTGLLNLLEPHLKSANLQFTRLDGSLTLQARQAVVTRFRNDPKVAVMLMSLKAGGVGLDLCCANRIYLLDPWWNPSVEQQAIDRVHRLGQTKPVETVRLFIKGSIEENILALQEKKSNMAKEALNDQEDPEDGKKKQTADERKRMRLADLKFLFHDKRDEITEADEVS